MKEVVLNKLLGWNPEFLATVVNDLVLVRVTVDGVGAGRSVEKVGEKVG